MHITLGVKDNKFFNEFNLDGATVDDLVYLIAQIDLLKLDLLAILRKEIAESIEWFKKDSEI